MHRIVHSVLLGSAIAFASMGALAADKKSDLSISAAGVKVDVGLGGKKGLKANVDASIGGKKGIKANVDAALGGKKALKANVDASIGGKKGVKANVDAGLGGKKGLKAVVDAVIGGKKGLNANVDVGVGKNVNVDIGLGTNTNGTRVALPDKDDDGTGPDGKGTLTSAQRQAFNNMPASERTALIKRCASVNAGGYDPSLVQLCKLLRMSASR